MGEEFRIDIDLYERITAVRRQMKLPTSSYLEDMKASLKDKKPFFIKGNKVIIKRGQTCLN